MTSLTPFQIANDPKLMKEVNDSVNVAIQLSSEISQTVAAGGLDSSEELTKMVKDMDDTACNLNNFATAVETTRSKDFVEKVVGLAENYGRGAGEGTK